MNHSLFSRQTWPLWLGVLLVAVVPQLSIWRTGPLSSFFLEAGALLFALVFVVLTAVSGSLKSKLPDSSWYFLILAAFWAVQARAMNLPYLGMSDMVSWTFVIIALMCWACRSWVLKLGAERVISVLAGALLVGSLAQATVGWLQYTGWASKFSGYLMYRAGIVEGQLAQRNHFAHYLMWGVLSAGWLWSQRRLAAWLALPAMFYIAATMGLTGSRTVFGYMLAMLLLLPVYRVISGCKSNHTVLMLGIAAAVVLLCQFAIEPALALFRDANLTSAAERISHGSQIEGSGRGYEWRKAWMTFLSAPLLGHGWGSYSLYGFLTNAYPTTFRPYENNVLFTHSHNSFLNLLAEMGIVGTALVLVGLLYSVRGSLKRANSPNGVFLLALLSVSLVHSVLEYPLWYIYFLVPFALFIGFTPPADNEETQPLSGSLKIYNAAALIAVAFLVTGIVRLGFAYETLRKFSGSSNVSVVERTDNIVGLLTIAKTEPMLRYYAQLQLANYVNPMDSRMPEWALEHIGETMQYRPYANAHKYAMAAYRAGKIKEAKDWMILMYHYYPSKMPAYASPIMNTDYYPELREDYTRECKAYYASINKLPICAEALPTEKSILKMPASAKK
ncbi:Wzy polymerase domain-containing protein [Kingella negevensis]|uniref:O-Antigen ligase n=1 Tax=Kingella negevensis TaxID=1522312 RepID=A0A238TE53_9NEIS|nr:PglL family O-oligosaccharyltransferase [Kingella negevensis]MDK4683393.1 Wzy polymerase domain-containing protein [Kingella negevensis]MDK4685063.1 Wzy polymerase domain-containing protein [Kingella negevensis]MDK4697276.1 Wzy polymerase domain-containing protein [Kingella negevensis]SNB84439.1 O-Antigen ligase [Kingella negevensis]